MLIIPLVFSACYDPIYYTIARESKPTDARFPGVPSALVRFRNSVYASSGSLQRYTKKNETSADWSKVTPPRGKLTSLAATDTALYTMAFTGDNLKSLRVYKTTNESPAAATDWIRLERTGDKISDHYPYIDSLFADEKTAFIGLKNADYDDDDEDDTDYALGYEKDGVIHMLMTGNKPVTGAVWVENTINGITTGYHILSTLGDGFYVLKDDMSSLLGQMSSGDLNVSDSFQYGDVGPGNTSQDWGLSGAGSISGEGKVFKPVRMTPTEIRNAYIYSIIKLPVYNIDANGNQTGVKKNIAIALRTNGEILAFDETMRLFRWGRYNDSSIVGGLGIWAPVPSQTAPGRPDWQPVFVGGDNGDEFKRYKNRRVLTIGLYSGYTELVIDADGTPRTDTNGSLIFSTPGRNDIRVSTMKTDDDSYQQYANSLAKHAVRGFFQAPQDIDPEMTFFAATYDEGLWSYRYRDTTEDDEWTWNHEE